MPQQTPTGEMYETPMQGGKYGVTACGPAPGQVQKNYSGFTALTGSPQAIPIETVTTGRTYYVTDIIATTDSASQILFSIKTASTIVFNAHITSAKGLEAPGLETQPTAASTQQMTINFPAGTGNVAWNVYGFES